MTNYQELKQKLDALTAEAEAARLAERASVLDQVRENVALYALTQQEVFEQRRSSGKSSRVPPKYRDPATGATWSGRGREPAWIASQDHARFLIKTVRENAED
ncbi:hypothetical protein WT83_16625 [Burkholderia territorii]|uniref:DNA-binding protein H-NS-like C-terminal domain-containing protein n=1 Tax=Burkholderia territorii TaxID=1503055 RepID=A0A125K6S6_9BURK|nr:H-NS histone family protein [Burkholderia territorii]KWN14734.1 hypothetical protein WT83_16625 [Burkholderia territorii]